ncbi:MAG: glycosyltransferase [Acidimicrobiales bacterium]|nr:glycosyltransferase [Acidimicrobiales bacterium]
MTAVAVNGRFRHLEPGGYRRYADEVSTRIPGATVFQPSHRYARGLRGRTWEQSVLARRSHDHVLFSPANSGPIHHHRQVVVLHDIYTLQRPEWFDPNLCRFQRRFLPRLVANAQRVVVPSMDVANRVSLQLRTPAHKVVPVAPAVGTPFGLDTDPARRAALAERLGLADGQPLVTGLVSASVRKNSSHTLAVLAEARRRTGAVVAVAGHDDRPRAVAGGARPSHPDVIDLGSLNDHDLAAFYALADVFVSLPLGEGYGMPIAEAAACGASIVASPVPAATESLEGHCTVVEATDLYQAVTAIEWALAEDSAAAAAARYAAATSWTWRQASDRINRLLKELND